MKVHGHKVTSCRDCPFIGPCDGMAAVCRHPTNPFFDEGAPFIIEDIADRGDPPPVGCDLRVEGFSTVVELEANV